MALAIFQYLKNIIIYYKAYNKIILGVDSVY